MSHLTSLVDEDVSEVPSREACRHQSARRDQGHHQHSVVAHLLHAGEGELVPVHVADRQDGLWDRAQGSALRVHPKDVPLLNVILQPFRQKICGSIARCRCQDLRVWFELVDLFDRFNNCDRFPCARWTEDKVGC